MEDLGVKVFNNFYKGKKVLVTGHTGFKGSWLVLWLKELGAEVVGLSLDSLTSPSHWDTLGITDILEYRVDIRDAFNVQKVINEQEPEIIFHLAAQSLVRYSYKNPEETFSTNVMGLIHLLQAARNSTSVKMIINATTDKVYAENNSKNAYLESSALGGHDPYSSSKACAELITECWRKSYFNGSEAGIKIATARAGNVIGGGDWAADRLVPDLIRATINKQPLVIRNPNSIRPWQHVLEPLSGYLRLAQLLDQNRDLSKGWNFGPETSGEVSVNYLIEGLSQHWEKPVIHYHSSPQYEATILRLNAQAAQLELGWKPVWNVDETLKRTVNWYKDFYLEKRIQSLQDLEAYIQMAKEQNLEWVS